MGSSALATAGCGGGGGSSSGPSQVELRTTDLPSGTTGLEYQAALDAVFGHPPGTFLLISGQLPVGVSLNETTGVISGWPHQVGTFRFEIEARDGENPASARDFTFAADRKRFVVTIERGLPNFVPQTIPRAQYRASYSYRFDVAGGREPYTFQQVGGELPEGLSVSSSGILGSFPSRARQEPYEFDVRVTDADGNTDVETFQVGVVVLPLIIETTTVPSAAEGFPYATTLTLASAGGGSPYTWSQMPPAGGETDLAAIGMEVTPQGVLRHRAPFDGPVGVGNYTFRVRVIDEALQEATRSLTIRINPGPVLSSITPRRSSQPGPFTATGLNFQPGAELIFSPGANEVSILPTFVDSTTLRFPTAPAVSQNGAITVRVRNPDGGFYDLPLAFLYPFANLSFGTKGFLGSALSSTGLAVGDLNGDGLADLVHSGASGYYAYPNTSTAGGLNLHMNLGGGTFGTTALDGGNFYDVKIVDLNVDGKPDIAAIGPSQMKTWLNGTPLGTLTAGPTSALPGGFSYPSEMAFGLLNSDSIPDVVFGVPHYPNPNGQVHSMAGNGTGAFSVLDSAVSNLTNTYGVLSVACADYSGDNRADVVAGQGWSNSSGPVMRHTTTTTTGSFAGWSSATVTGLTWGNTVGIAAGDFFGTGKPNQFVCVHSQDPGDGNQRLVRLFSGATLGTTQSLPTPSTLGKSVGVVDADLDGKSDFAVSTHTGSVVVYRGSTLAITQTLDAAAGAPGISSPRTGRVAFGDLDGDGREDLVVTTSYWAYDYQPNHYGNTYALQLAGNGGSMGIVFWLNSSN